MPDLADDSRHGENIAAHLVHGTPSYPLSLQAELLNGYEKLLDEIGRLGPIVVVSSRNLVPVPRARWLVRSLAADHIDRTLESLGRRYAARAALGLASPEEEQECVAARRYRESLPPIRRRRYAVLAVITAILIASVILPRYARFFLPSSSAATDINAFISALEGQVEHPLAIRDLLGQLNGAKPWDLAYAVTGIGVILWVVLRPLAAAYRLKRLIFSLYPDTSRLSAVPIRLSVSRSMGVYDLEDRLFRHLGARRPAEPAYDLIVAALPMPFILGLGYPEPAAAVLLTAIAVARLGWLLRTWRSRLSTRPGTIRNVVVSGTSRRRAARWALGLGILSVVIAPIAVIPAVPAIFLATWSDATSTYSAGRYNNRAVTLAAKISALAAIVAGIVVDFKIGILVFTPSS